MIEKRPPRSDNAAPGGSGIQPFNTADRAWIREVSPRGQHRGRSSKNAAPSTPPQKRFSALFVYVSILAGRRVGDAQDVGKIRESCMKDPGPSIPARIDDLDDHFRKRGIAGEFRKAERAEAICPVERRAPRATWRP